MGGEAFERVRPAKPVKVAPKMINNNLWHGKLARTIIIPAVALLILSLAAAAAADSGDSSPSSVVQKLNATLLAAMKGGQQLGFSGRYAMLAPVIEEVFDLPKITQISVGRKWQLFSQDQKRNLTRLYTRWSTATYADSFADYAGQSFDIRSTAVAGNKAVVESSLNKKNGEKIDFLYVLTRSGGTWQIVDIHVKGVSQLAMTREQFSSTLEHGGYNSLVQALEEKIKETGSWG